MSRSLGFFLALRPWSFPMTIAAITAGSLYAYGVTGSFDITIYLLTLAGAVALHAFVNITNDYFDTLYGVDRPGAPTTRYRPHPIVSGLLTPSQTLIASAVIFAIALSSGIALTLIDRWLSIPLGLLGALVALEYTAPPARFKYRGLGELGVFAMWGPLMHLGAFYTQTGLIDLRPIAISIPIGSLVASVLVIDSIRDYEFDRSSGIRTLTVIIGKEKAFKLYIALIALAYIAPPALALAGVARPWILAALVTLPRALQLVRWFSKEVPDTAAPFTAQLTIIYGIIYSVSLAI
ncbi:MAG: 1,4-dihydroxy-2-naphthoate octaprenyltransferase [Sulfolobales archaeon]